MSQPTPGSSGSSRHRSIGTIAWTVVVVFALLLVVTATVQSGLGAFLMMSGLIAVLVGVAGFLTRGRTPGVSTRRSGGVTALAGAVAVVIAAMMLPRSDVAPAVSTLAAEVAVDTSAKAQAAAASASSVAARSSAAVSSVRSSSAVAASASSAAASSAAASAAAASAAASSAAAAAQAEADRVAAEAAAQAAAQAEADRVASEVQAEKSRADQAEADRVAVAKAETDRVAVTSAAARTSAQAAAAPPVSADTSGCDIKGNIASDGEHIYHVPGGGSYAATKISESKGERWFCSEAEAQAAGWRKARN